MNVLTCLADADTVCARAKIHFDPTLRGGDWSESGNTDVSENLEAFKKDYLPTHSNQAKTMYFSVRVVVRLLSGSLLITGILAVNGGMITYHETTHPNHLTLLFCFCSTNYCYLL
jgi:hypothetical protein